MPRVNLNIKKETFPENIQFLSNVLEITKIMTE